MREAGTTGMGPVKGGAVVVMAAVDIGSRLGWYAGVAFFFLGYDGSKGASRPKAKPTEDVPTTAAVAQSCITRERQSWRLVRHIIKERYRGKTGLVQALSEVEASWIETYQNKSRAAAARTDDPRTVR
jgi:hypothetical protein